MAEGGGDVKNATRLRAEYGGEKQDTDQTCLVIYRIPGLKKPFFSFLGKPNVDFTLKLSERGYELNVVLNPATEAKKFEHIVKELPGCISIDESKTRVEVKKGKGDAYLQLTLWKAEQSSWVRTLSAVGLECAQDD